MDTMGEEAFGTRRRSCLLNVAFILYRAEVINYSQRLMELFFSSCLSMTVSVLFIDIILIRFQGSGSVATWCGFIQLSFLTIV